MSESVNDPEKGKKILYTCPCGFSCYDLIEFLKHPFMEYAIEQDRKVSTKSDEESNPSISGPEDDETPTHD
jgi:hypothetical protein